jgi:hypothetical protein
MAVSGVVVIMFGVAMAGVVFVAVVGFGCYSWSAGWVQGFVPSFLAD